MTSDRSSRTPPDTRTRRSPQRSKNPRHPPADRQPASLRSPGVHPSTPPQPCRAAIVDRRGPDAVSWLSRESPALYPRIRDSALCAPKRALDSDSLFERLTALLFRQAGELEFLRGATPEELGAYILEHAWLTGDELTETNVLETEHHDGYAVVHAMIGEREAYLALVQEAGSWKIDLRPILRRNNVAIARMSASARVRAKVRT